MTADPEGFTITHTGLVTMWERDENDHWNGRYYMRAFQAATETLELRLFGRSGGAAATESRHIRFLRELRGGDPLVVRSARVRDAAGRDRLLHLMSHAGTGALAASALDKVRFDLSALPPARAEDIAEFGPRSLADEPASPQVAVSLLAQGRAIVSHASVVRPRELDHLGRLTPCGMHGRMNEGVPHLWEHAGVSISDLPAQGLGRAMVEFRADFHGDPAGAGDPVRMVSWFDEVNDRAIRMRHQLENAATGAPLASIATVALVIDLATRRAAPIPAFLREAHTSLGGG